MNFSRTQIIALVILTLALAGLIALSLQIGMKNKTTSLNKEKIERNIHQKEVRLNEIAEYMQNTLRKQSLSDVLSGNAFPFSHKKIASEGFSLFIYKNDSLAYWTNNKIDVAGNFKKSRFKERIVKYNNGWYLTTYTRDSTYQTGAAYLLKHQYPLTNQYLTNTFQKDLNIASGNNYRISFVEVSFGLPVHGADGDYLFSITATNNNGYTAYHKITGILLLFLVFAGLFIFAKPYIERSYLKIGLFLIIIAAIRFLMMHYQFPDLIYRTGLFAQLHFNTIPFIHSLGDLLLDSLTLFYFAFVAYLKPNRGIPDKIGNGPAIIFTMLSWIGVLLLAWAGQKIITSLLLEAHAPLDIYQPLNLESKSLLVFLILTALLASMLFIIYKIFYHIRQLHRKTLIFLIGFIIYAAAFAVLWMVLDYSILFKKGLSGLLLFSLLCVYCGIKTEFNHYQVILLIFFAAVYITYFLHLTQEHKITESEKTIVNDLKDRRDKVTENILERKTPDIRSDEKLKQLIIDKNPGSSEQVDFVKEYIQKNYFRDYLNRFEFIVTICGPGSAFIPTNHTNNCLGYYHTRIKNYGQDIDLEGFHFLETPNGETEYLGRFNFYDENSRHYLLYISLRSKFTANEGGYPYLLTNAKQNSRQIEKAYSYAKYENNKLVKKSGSYYYDQIDRTFNKSEQTYEYVEGDDYAHLVYRFSPGDKVILTRPAVTLRDHATTFSYIFVFLIIITYLFMLMVSGNKIIRNLNLNFKNRIKLAMLVVLLLSFILIGAGTIYLNKKQFEQKHKERIAEKIKSVSTQIEKEFAGTSSLENSLRLESPESIDMFLKGYSKVFQTDINIYNLNGYLIGSSRPQIFRKKLLTHKIHPEAWYHLKYRHESRFIHNENIGKLTYASAYIPLYNQENAVIGYLNLPYFKHPQILGREISNMLVAVLNIYVLLLIITSAVAVLIANKATHPLYLLEQKFRAVRIGRRNEPIEYKGNDEIGRIVSAYNEMMSKLTDSIEKLAETEREMAWREMARQIAHEIRNPLTPMKLSIQHLQKSWKSNSEKFPERFENVSQTLIEQIDTLSSIAAEFSNFAKMPTPNIEDFNIISRLENVILLFENTEQNTELIFNDNQHSKIRVLADKEQMQRVFINIIKNGIQSIPDDRKGIITITVSNKAEHALIKISDNGDGIPEDKKDKLFRPSFTTKSGGMGMGLAIVKNIVEATGGKIWFETAIGKGTTFFIQLPLADEEQATEQEGNNGAS